MFVPVIIIAYKMLDVLHGIEIVCLFFVFIIPYYRLFL